MIGMVNIWYLPHNQPFFFSDTKFMNRFEKKNPKMALSI